MQDDDLEEEYDGPSKSQLKREAKAIVDLGERLLDVPEQQLLQLPYQQIIDAVQACKKITKGNARKRQLQYIGKLIRSVGPEAIQKVVDRFDASSKEHNLQFQQLETWRERLINNDKNAMSEIMDRYPDLDRQHLRQLVRNAINEAEKEIQPPVNFRKLFQFLKSLSDNQTNEES